MNGENHRGKTLPGDFKVTTPKNPLLLITSNYKYKESYQTLWSIPKYQSIVEPLPQYPIGLVLQWQFFHSMNESQYVTNQLCTNPSTWLTHQLKEDVGCKVLHFINNENQEALWLQNPWRKDEVASSKRIMN